MFKIPILVLKNGQKRGPCIQKSQMTILVQNQYGFPISTILWVRKNRTLWGPPVYKYDLKKTSPNCGSGRNVSKNWARQIYHNDITEAFYNPLFPEEQKIN